MKAIQLTEISPEELAQLIEESTKKALEKLSDSQPTFNPSERLTRKQVSEEYKVSFPTIHSLMRQRRLIYEKVGRKTLFKRSEVEKAFSQNRR